MSVQNLSNDGCDLEKSVIFEKIVKVTIHVHFPSSSCCKHIVDTELCEIERFQTAKVTFYVTKSHWKWCN